MKIEEIKKYKRILILGYGKEGKATEKFLKKYVPDAKIGIADKNINDHYLDEQKKYDLVIRSPGIPKKLVTKPYTTATNIFMANINNFVIGVTGTKGKSTTASLIYAILKADGKKVKLIGNIGKPMLEELIDPVDKETIYVIELSSYQLEDIKYSPNISVILDLFPEHMNYHGNVENYFLAKKNILKKAEKNNYYVYNPRFIELEKWSKEVNCITVPFEQNIHINYSDIPLIGEHNLENIKAAVTISHLLKIKDKTIHQAVKNFKPLPHRLEKIGVYKEIIFYDDAISTTPQSTIFAIKSLKNIGTIFLGGEDRGYSFEDLVKTVFNFKIKNLVLFPESGKKIYEIIKANNFTFQSKILITSSMKEAVKFAYQFTPKGKICLLSCASPSYSLWKSFEEKGDEFKRFVKKYA